MASGRSPSNRKKERYHHGDLRRALVDTALALIAERGVTGLTLREIARRIGVTHAAPYRHFEDKSALVAEVRREGFEQFVERLEAARARHPGDARAQLIATGVSYVRFAVDRPAHFRVMFGPNLREQEEKSPALRIASRRAFGVLVESIEACQDAGVVRPGDARLFAVTSWSVVHGLSCLVVDGLVPTARTTVEALAEMVTQHLSTGLGLEATPPTRE